MLSVLNLLTLSTISVDSCLAFFAGLRYRQIATLIKSIHTIKATICIVSRIARLCCSLDYLSLFWYGLIIITSRLKIFVNPSQILWSSTEQWNMSTYEKKINNRLTNSNALLFFAERSSVRAIKAKRVLEKKPHYIKRLSKLAWRDTETTEKKFQRPILVNRSTL